MNKTIVNCGVMFLFAGLLTSMSFAGAFNFQEPSEWTVGDAGSTFQEWEAFIESPFLATNSPPTNSNVNPAITTLPGMSVQNPGFVASSGGYYSFGGNYWITANIYNHGGSAGTGAPYSNNHGTRVIVQTAATVNPDFAASVYENSIEIVKLDGTAIAGGTNADLLSVMELFCGEVETSFGLADQQELRFEYYLPAYSADFRVRFTSSVHSSFQELRVDTLLVEESLIEGDFDGDRDVDAGDLADWQASYGVDAVGDADGDGDSDGRDFLIWQRNYTGPSPLTSALPLPPSAFIIPEPTSLLVVIFGIIIGLNCRDSFSESSR